MINSKEYYSARIAEFVRVPYTVYCWFFVGIRNHSVMEIMEFYQVIKGMWTTHRDKFSCKGEYKRVRITFVKYATRNLSNRHSVWRDLPADFCKEVLDKVNQGWISSIYEVDEAMWEMLIQKAEGYTGDKRHPWRRLP